MATWLIDRSRARRALAVVVVSTWALVGARAAGAQPSASGCETCHRGLAAARLSTPARDFALADVHRERGFACADCHGGDRDAVDRTAAKAPATGYRGAPAPREVIAVCARCHSDAALMRKYAPAQRVDQAAEYATSVHGRQLASGDTNVATCVGCHGAHGIRRVGDAQSPVYPTNVAATCTRCHADAERMRGYALADGTPLPTDQRARYEKSVHHEAMVVRGDLSAPTCNDCHGNHGAVPPGVDAIANVCGTCHAVFATRFALSTHSQVFERGCVDCHRNHDIAAPTDAMIGTDSTALCATCHTDGDNGFKAAAAMRGGIESLKAAIAHSESRVAAVENAGMEMGESGLALREAANHLTLARTEMHAFDPAGVEPVLLEGLALTRDVDAAADAAEAELSFRRTGLAVSLGAILLVVVALQLKIGRLGARAKGGE